MVHNGHKARRPHKGQLGYVNQLTMATAHRIQDRWPREVLRMVTIPMPTTLNQVVNITHSAALCQRRVINAAKGEVNLPVNTGTRVRVEAHELRLLLVELDEAVKRLQPGGRISQRHANLHTFATGNSQMHDLPITHHVVPLSHDVKGFFTHHGDARQLLVTVLCDVHRGDSPQVSFKSLVSGAERETELLSDLPEGFPLPLEFNDLTVAHCDLHPGLGAITLNQQICL